MHLHECKKCKTPWESMSPESVCPNCGEENIAEVKKSQEEQDIEKILNSESHFSIDMQDAQAHIAVGLAGCSKILEIMNLQKEHLRERAKELSTRSRFFEYDLSMLEDFLDAPILIVPMQEFGHFEITYPKFIKVDLSECEYTTRLSVSPRYNTIYVTKAPEWLNHYVASRGLKGTSDDGNQSESDNSS